MTGKEAILQNLHDTLIFLLNSSNQSLLLENVQNLSATINITNIKTYFQQILKLCTDCEITPDLLQQIRSLFMPILSLVDLDAETELEESSNKRVGTRRKSEKHSQKRKAIEQPSASFSSRCLTRNIPEGFTVYSSHQKDLFDKSDFDLSIVFPIIFFSLSLA